jgi:hypothetical protein
LKGNQARFTVISLKRVWPDCVADEPRGVKKGPRFLDFDP